MISSTCARLTKLLKGRDSTKAIRFVIIFMLSMLCKSDIQGLLEPCHAKKGP